MRGRLGIVAAGCIATLTITVVVTSGCSRQPSSNDSGASDIVPHDSLVLHPTKLDILVVVPQFNDNPSFIIQSGVAAGALLTPLFSPADGKPVKDLHFGVVSSKVRSDYFCTYGNDLVLNDGTLLQPEKSSQVTPVGPFLSTDSLKSDELKVLAMDYIRYYPTTEYCDVTQFLESAALAIDGRNKDFVRDDSLLLILIFAGTEDCSTKTPSMWSSFASTKYRFYTEWCYYPPSGLLYDIDRYVEIFGKKRREGVTLVSIAGKEGTPVFYDSGGYIMFQTYCNDYFAPTLRLPSLVKSLNALGDSRVEASMFEYCDLIYDNKPSMKKIASRILEIMSR